MPQEPLSRQEWKQQRRLSRSEWLQQRDGQAAPMSREEWRASQEATTPRDAGFSPILMGGDDSGMTGQGTRDVLRSMAQGFTFGTSDELRGLARGAAALVPGGKSPREAFHEGVEAERAALDEIPMGRRLVGEIAGGIPTGVGIGKAVASIPRFARMASKSKRAGEALGKMRDAGKLGNALPKRARTLKRIQRRNRVGLAGAQAAADAGIYGLGASEGDLGDRAATAAAMAAGGAVVGRTMAGGGLMTPGRVMREAADKAVSQMAGTTLSKTLGEGVALNVLPWYKTGGNMGSYMARKFGRDVIGGGIAKVAKKVSGFGSRFKQPPIKVGKPPAAKPGLDDLRPFPAQPLPPNPARALPARTGGAWTPPAPAYVGPRPAPTPPPLERTPLDLARRGAMISRAQRGGRPPPVELRPYPAQDLPPDPGRALPRRITTPPPGASSPVSSGIAPQPDFSDVARREAMMSRVRRGRIGAEASELLSAPPHDKWATPAMKPPVPGIIAGHRDAAANKIVQALRSQIPEGATPQQLADFIENQGPEARRVIEREVGLEPRSDKTWKRVFDALRKGGDELPMDEGARMKRASVMGFDVDAYHGTQAPEDFRQFRTTGPEPPDEFSGLPYHSGASNDPSAYMGAHFAAEPGVASRIAEGRGADWLRARYTSESDVGPRVIPTKLRGRFKQFGSEREVQSLAYQQKVQNYLVDETLERQAYELVDNLDEADDMLGVLSQRYDDDVAYREEINRLAMSEATDEWQDELAAELGFAAREHLKSQGFDGFAYDNIVEGGRSYAVFEPHNIRSRFARFDPRKSSSADLLAGIAGATAAGGIGSRRRREQ